MLGFWFLVFSCHTQSRIIILDYIIFLGSALHDTLPQCTLLYYIFYSLLYYAGMRYRLAGKHSSNTSETL